MSKMWKVASFAVAAVVAMSLATGAFAAEEKKAEGKKPQAPQKTGAIVSIDKECIKIKPAKGDEVMFSITEKTKFGTKADPKTCSDFKCGDKVTVRFKEEGDKKVALSVVVPPPAKKKADK
jgi:Cu/Ag efflux protein CusF